MPHKDKLGRHIDVGDAIYFELTCRVSGQHNSYFYGIVSRLNRTTVDVVLIRNNTSIKWVKDNFYFINHTFPVNPELSYKVTSNACQR